MPGRFDHLPDSVDHARGLVEVDMVSAPLDDDELAVPREPSLCLLLLPLLLRRSAIP
jgi:hypothetical protein